MMEISSSLLSAVLFKDTPKFNPRRRMSVLERSASSVTSTTLSAVGSQYTAASINSKRPNSSVTSSPANSSIASNNSSISAATNTTGIGSINGSTGGGASTLSSPHSQNQLNLVHQNHMQNHHFSYSPAAANSLRPGGFNSQAGPFHRKPPSPSPSDRSLPPFSSSGSSMSETSTGSSTAAQLISSSNNTKLGGDAISAAVAVPGHIPGISISGSHHSGGNITGINPVCVPTNVVPGTQNLIEDEQLDTASALAVAMTNDPHNMEVMSLSSSGVGTTSGSQSGSAGSSALTPTGEISSSSGLHQSPGPRALITPGMHVVCVENYNLSHEEGSLRISQGDIIQVIASTDTGLLKGVLRGQCGYFPAQCVQEVRLRNPESHRLNATVSLLPYGRPLNTASLQTGSVTTEPRVPGRRETREQQQMQQQHFATAYRHKDKITPGEPRSAILHKGKRGFGFVLRGAKAASPLMEMIPSHKCPGLQYMDDVDPGGVADMSGILKGDFLLEINGEDVRQASHEIVVGLIRKSGDLVALTVVTVLPHMFLNVNNTSGDNSLICSTSASPSPSIMSMSINSTAASSNSNGGSMKQARQYSTLPRKLHGSAKLQVHPPPPPKRDPNTTLSVGKARARSMVANLAAIEALDKAISEHDSSTSESVTESVNSIQRMPDLLETAYPSIGDLIDLNGSDRAKKKVYASVAEMKRSKLQYNSKLKFTDVNNTNIINDVQIHKDFSSTPDLKKNIYASTMVAINPSSGVSQTLQGLASKETSVFNDIHGVSQNSRNSGNDNFHVLELNAKNIDKCSNKATPGSNINSDLISDHLTDTRLLINGADGRVGHQRGYYTLPSRHRKLFEEGGSYRTVTRIRPVIKSNPENRDEPNERCQTMMNHSTLSPNSAPPAPPPPPEHPPPPPPITQVLKLDSKSDYAKVEGSKEQIDTKMRGMQQNTSANTDGKKQITNEETVVSPGGTVRSSFKPSDNAKLYASPQTIQPVAYRSPATNRAMFENQNFNDGKVHTSPTKKRSPTARAHSMPPRPSRPQVLRRSSITDMTLPSPITSASAGSSSTNVETYNINGVNYTTYTTFRSPITPEECDVPGSLSSRTFSGVDPDLTPTASEPEEMFSSIIENHPHIPEPDYDMSDSDYGGSSSNGNNYYCGSDIYNNMYRHNGCREESSSNGTTLERKKKKTVSFVINEEVAAKLQAGRTTRQDSILKDPVREREREKERVEKERLEREREELFSTSKQKAQRINNALPVQQPSPFALGERYAEPMEKIPFAKLKSVDNSRLVCASNQHHQQSYQQSGINISNEEDQKPIVRVAEADKIRIEVPPEVPVKVVLSRSNSAVGNPSNNTAPKHQPLQKSRSFCAEKSLLSVSSATNNTAAIPNTSVLKPVKSNAVSTLTSISSKNSIPGNGNISENEILRARSQLKSSRSFTNEFPKKSSLSSVNTQGPGKATANINSVSNDTLGTDINHEEAENSSSGVSSDQEQNVNSGSNHFSSRSSTTAAKFVTYLPVDGGAASTLEVGSAMPGNNYATNNTICATGRTGSLQQSNQVIDNISESGSDDVSSEKSWVLRAEQDNLGRNIIYMKKMLHPKLQAIFDKPTNGSNGVAPGSSSSSTNSSSPTPQCGMSSLSPKTNNNTLVTSSPKEQDSLLTSSMSSTSSSSASSSSNRLPNQKYNTSSSLASTHNYSSQTLPHRHQYQNYLLQQQYSQQNKQGSSITNSENAGKHFNDERSIVQSLALINQHVNSLGEVNVLAGITKHTCESGSAEPTGAVLAPPPGFSDLESHSDSLISNERNKSAPNKKVTFGTNIEHLRKSFQDSKLEPTMNSIMTRSVGPVYDGSSTTQVLTADIMSRSSVNFDTTVSHLELVSGGRGNKTENKTTTSVSYATLPKKQHLNIGNQKVQSHHNYSLQTTQHQKEFRTKPLIGWSITDVCDWLDSLFMPEYKPAFLQNEVDGFKLASITKSELESLGVIRVGHMLNIERSLKRYLTA